METKHIKLYSGSSIIINRLKTLLEEQNIETLIKDNHESGRLAGFGTLDNDVELFVFEDDLSKAKEITTKFKSSLHD